MTATHTHTPEQEAVITRVEEELLSGRNFALYSQAHATYPGRYDPPCSIRDFKFALQVLTDLAGEGQRFAQLVCAVGIPNMYGSSYDICRTVAMKMSAKLREGWDDVHARTGPEPYRHKDAQHTYNLRDRILVRGYLAKLAYITHSHVPGHGWVLAELADRNNVRLPTIARAEW